MGLDDLDTLGIASALISGTVHPEKDIKLAGCKLQQSQIDSTNDGIWHVRDDTGTLLDTINVEQFRSATEIVEFLEQLDSDSTESSSERHEWTVMAGGRTANGDTPT